MVVGWVGDMRGLGTVISSMDVEGVSKCII